MHDIDHTLPHLLNDWGYAVVFVATVADSLGVPIPGEATLIFAGVYAGATHRLLLPLVIVYAAAGAIIGDNFTYVLGRRGGYPFLLRHGHWLHLGHDRLRLGQFLFARYGGQVVWTGRFVPILHIWTAVLAGVSRMPWVRFVVANGVGAFGWAALLACAGFVLGKAGLKLGTVITGAAIPIAIVIGVSVLAAVRVNERRFVERAEREMGNSLD